MLDKHVSFGWGEPVHSDEDGYREEFAVTRARSQRKIERERVVNTDPDFHVEVFDDSLDDATIAKLAQYAKNILADGEVILERTDTTEEDDA